MKNHYTLVLKKQFLLNQIILFLSLCFVLSASLLFSVKSYAETEPNGLNIEKTKPLKDTKFLGLKLIDADLNKVREQLWDIGGFLQAQTTVRQRNIDKFYPWTILRDSYYITFRYNHAGKVTSVKRLYRPYSLEVNNKTSAIQTQDIAMSLITELGKPTYIKRKNSGGGLSYLSYTWQDEDMSIVIDREGSERLGNIFIKYTIKTNDPYEVNKDNKSV